ncbi:hypothetical protein [Veillonella caviae]|uniref:hypothetical protein n=1 Tax=Veillonella caviae TaxID=248316 RepID=UPI0023A811ED|nr:hypothetical protein [Veillonella caviae]MCI5708706.1 hypothetical protein [Veillonella caviae]MCI6406353.1 hypothetical protein [Veillonella caviae]MDY4745915.1 hypothetical protein [Veillonella caviae]MDY5715983.1 hypothetical protein [Veillonella caviae]MDY6225025.1 hypothetical protein [Veillonella caviae]
MKVYNGKKFIAEVETAYEALEAACLSTYSTMDIDTIINDPQDYLIEDMPELQEEIKNGKEVLMASNGEYNIFDPKELNIVEVNSLLYNTCMGDFKVVEE